MLKHTILVLIIGIFTNCSPDAASSTNVFTSDIERFWQAYDSVHTISDQESRKALFQTYFMDEASEGQKAMFAARNYTVEEYLMAIDSFPSLWEAIRPMTQDADQYAIEMDKGVQKFTTIYPDYKPASIYFTIGAFRSNGTTMDSMVLIGSELALGDATLNTDELKGIYDHLIPFYANNPRDGIVFLNVHEYIHTQQNTTRGYNLLAQTTLEGVAEFVTVKALDMPSPNPQIAYGEQNDERIKSHFSKEMHSPIFSNWLWNSTDNNYGMRDLAYYVGYKIAEGYYNQAEDQSIAIKEMIELDYNDEKALFTFVETSGYFAEPIESYRAPFEALRPRVKKVTGIDLKGKNPSGSLKFEAEFPTTMNTRVISTDYSDKGADYFPKINSVQWSSDSLRLMYDINVEPNKDYEMVLHWNMRDMNNIPMIPDTLRFSTSD